MHYLIADTYVTVRVKTSLVHTFKFAILVVYKICLERHKQLKFTELVDITSLYHH